MDDSSVWLGGALVLLGIACVVLQLRWTASDRRKELEAAERAREQGEEPEVTPGPDPWERLPVQKRF